MGGGAGGVGGASTGGTPLEGTPLGGTPLGSSSGEEDEGAGKSGGGGFDMSKLKAKSRKVLGGPKGRAQVRRTTKDEEEEKKRDGSPDKKKKVRWGDVCEGVVAGAEGFAAEGWRAGDGHHNGVG